MKRFFALALIICLGACSAPFDNPGKPKCTTGTVTVTDVSDEFPAGKTMLCDGEFRE